MGTDADGSSGTISIGGLAKTLDVPPARVITAAIRAGVDCFGPNSTDIPLTAEQAQAITDALGRRVASAATPPKTKVKYSQRPTRQRPNTDPRTPEEIAAYTGATVEEVEATAADLGFVRPHYQTRFSRPQRRKILEVLLSDELAHYDGGGDEPLTQALGDLPMEEASKPRSTPVLQFDPGASHRRISVVAKDLGAEENLVEDIVAVLGLPVSADKNRKIEVCDIPEIEAALRHLPESIETTGDEVDLTSIAPSLDSTVSQLRKRCKDLGISVRSKKFIASRDALKMFLAVPPRATVDPDNDEAAEARKETSDTDTPSPAAQPVLRMKGLNLSRQDFSDYDFRNANLEETNLSNSRLDGARFDGANLRSANLTRASLVGSDLTRIDGTNVVLNFSNLTRCVLTDANLTGASLRGADLTGADLTGANLTGAEVRGARFENCNLAGAIWVDGEAFAETKLAEAGSTS
jgi:hypothetical protein